MVDRSVHSANLHPDNNGIGKDTSYQPFWKEVHRQFLRICSQTWKKGGIKNLGRHARPPFRWPPWRRDCDIWVVSSKKGTVFFFTPPTLKLDFRQTEEHLEARSPYSLREYLLAPWQSRGKSSCHSCQIFKLRHAFISTHFLFYWDRDGSSR